MSKFEYIPFTSVKLVLLPLTLDAFYSQCTETGTFRTQFVPATSNIDPWLKETTTILPYYCLSLPTDK